MATIALEVKGYPSTVYASGERVGQPIGHLPADRHEFTLPVRKQTRRSDVRLHNRPVPEGSWIVLRGMPVTLPSRIASDLLWDREDPEAVAHIVADAIREVYDYPGSFVVALEAHAAQFGLRRRDGVALLRWLLDLVGGPETTEWIDEARDGIAQEVRARRGLRLPSTFSVPDPELWERGYAAEAASGALTRLADALERVEGNLQI